MFSVFGEVPVILVFSKPAGWAPNLQSVVIPSGRHSAVVVNLRRVVQLAARLIQEKVWKECPCVESGSVRCATLREGEVQTMCFVT